MPTRTLLEAFFEGLSFLLVMFPACRQAHGLDGSFAV
jgi:hypothetical protein